MESVFRLVHGALSGGGGGVGGGGGATGIVGGLLKGGSSGLSTRLLQGGGGGANPLGAVAGLAVTGASAAALLSVHRGGQHTYEEESTQTQYVAVTAAGGESSAVQMPLSSSSPSVSPHPLPSAPPESASSTPPVAQPIALQLVVAKEMAKSSGASSSATTQSLTAMEHEELFVSSLLPMTLRIVDSRLIAAARGEKEVGLYLIEARDRETSLVVSHSWKRYTDFVEFHSLLKLNSSPSRFRQTFDSLPPKKPFFLSHSSASFLHKRQAELNLFLDALCGCELRPAVRSLLIDFALERRGLSPEETLWHQSQTRAEIAARATAHK